MRRTTTTTTTTNHHQHHRKDIEAAAATSTRLPSTVSGYERIRVVGKGSFGSAILYRRKADESLVVIKEINMHELSTAERQLALNEVSLLSSMDHPHIISYYDSFEEDGILMIEMEYADGGTLAQFLARRTDYVPEAEILYMFEQMLSAVSYLHDNNVLHRDLKTANIFLTKDHHIKIGDFGISKIMGTETRFAGAQTVVGTPYYISPEMCEGRSYNSKSDIWALGCILYEMACLQKTFEGSNLPALVGKIVKGDYEQIRGPYSNDLKLIVREMLKVEPELRPTATKVLEMVQRSRGKKGERFRGIQRSQSPRNCHSALYEFDIAKVTLSAVSNTPKHIRVKQLAVGQEHILMLTVDNVVYGWGNNNYGQLGLGDRRPRTQPVRIEVLDGKDITRIACGSTFSVFCADRGIVMVCGNRKFTGNGKTKEDYLKPKVIDSLLRDDIVDLSVGTEHAAAVCGDGQVFVWGNGQSGQLGTGKQEHVQTARKVEIPAHLVVINVKCGPDSTALITSCGTLILMGSNKYNKLNLNTRIGFFSHVKNTQSEVENILIPTCMKAFNSRVVDVSLGSFHSGVLLESGHVHLFGRNEYGELGLGHRQPMDFWVANRPVKALQTKACVQLFCGDGFTVVATADNELYFWGTKGIMRKIHDAVTIEDLEICERVETSSQQRRQTDSATKKDRCSATTTKKHWPFQKGMGNPDEEEEDICTIPSLVLRLDSTRDSAGSKPFIKLAQLEGKAKRVFVVINTSPSAPKETNLAIGRSTMMSLATNWGRRRRSAPELTETTVPTWVQNELNDAEYLSYSQFIPNQKPPIPVTAESLQTEKQLHAEIEELKRQVQKQSTTFKGHETQMALLQKKLAELQALHSRSGEAPPPYHPQSAKDGRKRPRIIQNPFTPQTPTKVCNIL